ncbi:VOC family protein [Anthocerotibacter panamensis]|uniref:VOC family protein n=1 Tax=Anthocerotibacter panamensis TaxID=2857077 RepID=UPI001C40207A|nr:VOC family protein [Anthocerotibacter panamensis]
MSDLGLTHVALPVTNLDASIAFYAKYARMQVVHHRHDPSTGIRVAWVTDQTRPFVIVLIEQPQVEHPLLPSAHLGVACISRAEVDRLCALAQDEGRLCNGPADAGPPVGYWAYLADPDGHTLELTFGQEVAFTVTHPEPVAASA